jgi:glycolate oxidase iron-sulfur subunit
MADVNPEASSGAGIDLAWLAERIEYRRFQECVHCGLCTASCPTYLETGNENDSPRGRIYLMRAVVDGRLPASDTVRQHLRLCLDCRACESACPSGVQYGQLVEPFKVAMQNAPGVGDRIRMLDRLVLHHLFPYPGRVQIALLPARWMQRLGLLRLVERSGLVRLLPPTLRRMVAMLPERLERSVRLPEILPSIGPRRARVALFLGCVGDALDPGTTAATVRVLRRNGCEVIVPRGQVCCGAIHYHSGVEGPAREFARRNLAAFLREDVDAVIVNAAGCGAMLKDYAHLLPAADRADAERFVARVRDVSEFLVELGPVPPANALPIRVAYHDACHLCHAQQIRAQPRQLLDMIPGLELVALDESEICCGAAGTYNLTEPAMSERLGTRKLDRIKAAGAEVVATGNIGCILQIARMARVRGDRIEVVHPIDLLDRAYSEADGLKPPIGGRSAR